MRAPFLILFGTMFLFGTTLSQGQIPTDHLQLWLRADTGVTITDSTVSNWGDQSGNGNDAIQSNPIRQPQLVPNGLNNKPVIRFDGWDDKLGFTASTPMSQFTLFLVVKNDIGGGPFPDHVITFGAPGGGLGEWLFMLFGGLANNPNRIGIGIGDYEHGIRAEAPNIAAYGEWRLLNMVTNQTINTTTLRWNRMDANMIPVGSDVPVSIPMGNALGSGGGLGAADSIPGGNPVTAKCDIAEVIVYDTVLTQSERLSVEQYLYDKWIVTGVSERKGDLPQRFVLEQNYPNPFNPTTTLSFSIPHSSFVILTVYDVLGREVRTPVKENLQAGSYEATFDATTLSSGVYLYRLTAGDFAQTRRMLLVR